MGNAVRTVMADRDECERCLMELKGFESVRSLGGGRLLRSYLCKTRQGHHVVVKIFAKKQGANLDLKPHVAQLSRLTNALSKIGSTASLDLILENPRALYLGRQFFANSLYDRLLTLPRLTYEEKRFITYQLFRAVEACHTRGVVHGDITCENIMITSWGWVILVDFASHKPASLYADDPAHYDLWFDTEDRTRCYVAPERFLERDQEPDEEVKASSDVFSLGCTITEVYLDGEALFTREKLLQYRKGKYDPKPLLIKRITNPELAHLLCKMTALKPSSRPTIDHKFRKTAPSSIIPKPYTYLYSLVESFLGPQVGSADARLLLLLMECGSILRELTCKDDEITISLEASMKSLEASIKAISSAPDFATQHLEILRKFAEFPNYHSRDLPENNVMEIIVGNLLAALPLATSTAIQCTVLSRIVRLSLDFISPAFKLESVLPVLLTMTSSTSPSVRSVSIQSTVKLVSTFYQDPIDPESSPPSKSKTIEQVRLFSHYILSVLQLRAKDPSLLVRVTFARSLFAVVTAACRFHSVKSAAALKVAASVKSSTIRERWRQHAEAHANAGESVREMVGDFIMSILYDTGNSSEKRGVIEGIAELMTVLGRRRVLDKLFHSLFPPFNDPDWKLRAGILRKAVAVAVFVAPVAAREYLLPCVVSSLGDYNESVAFEAVAASAALTKLELVKGRGLLAPIAKRIAPLLCHPSKSLRRISIEFLHEISQRERPATVYETVRPALEPFLEQHIGDVTRRSLRNGLRPSLTPKMVQVTVIAARQGAKAAARALSHALGERKISKFAERMTEYIVAATASKEEAKSKLSRKSVVQKISSTPKPPSARPRTRSQGSRRSFESSFTPKQEHGRIESAGSINLRIFEEAKHFGWMETGGDSSIGLPLRIPAIKLPEGHQNNLLSSLYETQAQYSSQKHPNTSIPIKGEKKHGLQASLRSPPAPSHPPPGIPSLPDAEEADAHLLISDKSRALSQLLTALKLAEKPSYPDSKSTRKISPSSGNVSPTPPQPTPPPKNTRFSRPKLLSFGNSESSTVASFTILGSQGTNVSPFKEKKKSVNYDEKEETILADHIKKALHLLPAIEDGYGGDITSETDLSYFRQFPRWEGGGRPAIAIREHQGAVRALCGDPRGRFFASGADQYVKIWGLHETKSSVGSRTKCEISIPLNNMKVTSLAVTMDSTVAYGTTIGGLHMMDISQSSSGDPLNFSKPRCINGKSLKETNQHGISAIQVHANLLVSATYGGEISIWDPRMRGSKPGMKYRMPLYMGVLKSIAIGPGITGYCMAAGSSTGEVSIWDIRYGLGVSRWALPRIREGYLSYCIDSIGISNSVVPAGRGLLWLGVNSTEGGAIAGFDIESGRRMLQVSNILPSLRNVSSRTMPTPRVASKASRRPKNRRPLCTVRDGTELITASGNMVKFWSIYGSQSSNKPRTQLTPLKLPAIAPPTPHKFKRQELRSSSKMTRRSAKQYNQRLLETESITGGAIISLAWCGQDSNRKLVAGGANGGLLLWS